jgi:hypothetical protein
MGPGKLGYGTVTECLSTSTLTPLIYVTRTGWPEEKYLIPLLESYNCGINMSQSDFYNGESSV